MIESFNKYFVTMFGLGQLKKIPGTISSFVTTIILFFYFHIFSFPKTFFLFFWLIITIYAFVAVANYIKSKQNKDPKEIVIDEFIGQSLPIYIYEISHGTEKFFEDSIYFYVIMFMTFRVFDIIKPFPVSYFDKNFKNSFGVIMDDIVAGLYVVLFIIFFMMIRVYFA
tara:strand:- start:1021 stop:1524 length:504 start_codon:yes stop_codon:yes gene_type:complete